MSNKKRDERDTAGYRPPANKAKKDGEERGYVPPKKPPRPSGSSGEGNKKSD